ncbi:MAG: tetratricopeptide repeat protein [Terriglobia bacterium]
MPKVAHAQRTICCHAAVALVLLGSIGGVRAWPLPPAQQESVAKVPSVHVIQSLPMDAASRGALTGAVKSRQYVQAERILINAIRQNPKSPRLLSFLGGIYFLNGDYLESAVAMKKAEPLAPLNNPDRFTLAMAYVVLNHSDWAQPEIERLTRSDPRNALYFYWLSRINYNQNHFDQGIAAGQKAIQLDSRFTRAYDNLGLCYEALGDYNLAIQAYGQAITLNRKNEPPSPWPPLDLGALLVKLNKPAEARSYLLEALRDDPRFPEAHFRLGLLLQLEGKNQDAIEQFKKAAALNPSYAEPHYALGRSYERLGNTEQARAEFSLFEKLKRANVKHKPQ